MDNSGNQSSVSRQGAAARVRLLTTDDFIRRAVSWAAGSRYAESA
jgi:hypothetical protein